MGLDTAPQRPFGGDLHRVRLHRERRDAEPFEMRLPGPRVGKLLVRVLGKKGDGGAGKRSRAHVRQGCVVDHVIGVSGTQQIEEVESALAAGGAEPSEVVVANLGAEAVAGFVPRAGIIHRDPARRLQPGAQYVSRFGVERALAANQQPHHLPLRYADTDRLQLCHQPRYRDLSLVILHQDVAL